VKSPQAFFAVDRGTATVAASVVGRIEGRWRLLASVAFPSAVPTDAALQLLAVRVAAADPGLAASLGAAGATGSLPEWPVVEARSRPSGTLAILAPSEHRREVLEAAAVGSGWRVSSVSLEHVDPIAAMSAALDRKVDAILVGAGAPPSPDERRLLGTLGPMVIAIAQRRLDVPMVLVGAAAQVQSAVDAARPEGPPAVTLREGGGAGPSADALRIALDDLRGDPLDSRRAIARATTTIAAILDRRVETVEVGQSGGVRAAAGRWLGRDDEPDSRWATVAAAGIVREEPDDELLDGVIAWSAVPIDRPRLRDRLRELWLAPWAEAHGEGALLRLTAARAALERLVAATPEFADLPSPDVLVVAGGVWSIPPSPAVAVAVLDVVRRTGVSQLLHDHARLLGPLGTIGDADERRAVMSDLLDDALAPLGTAVVPQGVRSGRFVGRAVIHRHGTDAIDRELVAGRIVTLEVPPGETGAAEFEFRDAVVLGGRGRRFAVDVAGGMAGVLVDLRDVPLRLPDGIERRRELLASWQTPLWRPVDA
jgi:hypothetical protein